MKSYEHGGCSPECEYEVIDLQEIKVGLEGRRNFGQKVGVCIPVKVHLKDIAHIECKEGIIKQQKEMKETERTP